MAFDVKVKIEELAKKFQEDPKLAELFKENPVKAVESLLGVDLPEEQLKPLVAGVQAKLAASGLSGKLDGIKKLF